MIDLVKQLEELQNVNLPSYLDHSEVKITMSLKQYCENIEALKLNIGKDLNRELKDEKQRTVEFQVAMKNVFDNIKIWKMIDDELNWFDKRTLQIMKKEYDNSKKSKATK